MSSLQRNFFHLFNMVSKVILLLLVLSVFERVVSLECYRCSGSTSPRKCRSTVTCGDGKVCYNSRTYSGQIVYDLGCVDKQTCGSYANRSNAVDVMKVNSGLTHNCHECCSTDKCNMNICEYKDPSLCADDDTIDCAFYNSLFNICTVISQAKKYCAKYCKLCDVVDGNWSPWSPWSQCDVTCDNGTLTRRRTCSDPAPQKDGLDCQGHASEEKPCFRELCPVHGGWAQWMQWGSCSVTCGIGLQRRNRTCTHPYPRRFGDHCFGDSHVDKICYPGPCSNGGWSHWQSWSNCSVVGCGTGFRQRSRTCSNPEPSPLGRSCVGNSIAMSTCEATCPSDCYDIKRNQPQSKSGIYIVKLWKSARKIRVFCDMETNHGGWTVFQNRFDGSVDFYRNFSQYEKGFGDLRGEFWLGLDFIKEIASQGGSDLRIDIEAGDGAKAYETLTDFYLSQGPDYTLHVGKTIDSLNISSSNRFGPYHNGSKFSTYDHGNSCAVSYRGAWWYKSCYEANLNGQYVTPGTDDFKSMNYESFMGYRALKSSRMMMRRN